MMKKKNDDNKHYINVIKNWITSAQPDAREMPELIGKSYSELESLCPSHYIPHDSNSGNLELTLHNGTVSCIIQNGICMKAYFISNDDE